MFKRAISTLISVVLVASFIPSTAYADKHSVSASPIIVQSSGAFSEEFLGAVKGWWDNVAHNYAAGSSSPWSQYHAYIHDGCIDWYVGKGDWWPGSDDGDLAFEYSATVNITSAERFDENGVTGWRFFTIASDWAYYIADNSQSTIAAYYLEDGYGNISSEHYNLSSPARFPLSRHDNDDLGYLNDRPFAVFSG